MALSSSPLVFQVRRHEPELVTPAKPTPHEFKYLSDIDDQEGLRFQIPFIYFYRNEPTMRRKDPVAVIRKALAEALVFYYPFAGRLREVHARKLVVECTGEGVLFIEADANVMLEQLNDALQPPFPCFEDLLYEVPGSSGVLDSPLLLIQVTRLMCGGFIFAFRFNHTMSDAGGLAQFLSAVGEMACGAQAPSVPPVWKREVFNARNPHPSGVTFLHREYEELSNAKGTLTISISDDDMANRSFFFGPSEIEALRKHLPSHLRCTSSTFEVLTACLWRCRTIAIQPDLEENICLTCLVSTRGKFQPPLVPPGYYGNTFALATVVSKARKLCENPLAYALDLVKKAKAQVTEEYMRSTANLLVMRGRPHFTMDRTYFVSDNTRAGFRDVDFGWGKAIYGGVAKGDIPSNLVSFYISFRNQKGVDGILVPVNLPVPAMERFVREIENMTKPEGIVVPVKLHGPTTERFVTSTM